MGADELDLSISLELLLSGGSELDDLGADEDDLALELEDFFLLEDDGGALDEELFISTVFEK